MSQATNQHTYNSSRRRFLAFTAAASAVGAGSLAVAAMPAPAAQCFATTASSCSSRSKSSSTRGGAGLRPRNHAAVRDLGSRTFPA